MPHSSGGGHSGGGFHGGSGFHGSSGSSHSNSNAFRISSTPFPGSHRYIYYGRHFRPHVIYALRRPTMGGAVSTWAGFFLTLLILLLPMIIILSTSYHHPKKLSIGYDTTIVIDDQSNVLRVGDQERLNYTFKSFLDKTGITPAFVSADRDWASAMFATSTERLAYREYMKRFSDEKHWLIYYCQENETDWSFEGMQGNDTDSILTKKVGDKFTMTFYNQLDAREGVCDSLIKAFDTISPNILKPYFEVESEFIPALAVWGLIGSMICVCSFVSAVKSFNARNAVEMDKDSIMVKCPHCGNPYYTGTVNVCPKCKGPLFGKKAAETKVDDEFKVDDKEFEINKEDY